MSEDRSKMEDWAMSLSQCAVAEYLEDLEMKVEGAAIPNLYRLTSWLAGVYEETMFEADPEPRVALQRRLQKRTSWLNKFLSEDDGTYVQATSEDVHPLAALLDDPIVRNRLLRLREQAAASSTPQQNPTWTSRPGTSGRLNLEREEPSQDDIEAEEPLLEITAADGSKLQLPKDFSILMSQVIQRITSLEQQQAEMKKNQRTSSTRFEMDKSQLDSTTQTFTVHHDSSERDSPIPAPRPRVQTTQPPARQVWEGGDSREARRPGWWNQTGPLGNNTTRMGGQTRDIGQIVRKWQIRFSGARSQSIDVFLARLEDCRTLANLSEEEVLSSLSELFTDTAATWYRNEKHKWTTWQDFLVAARRWYGTSKQFQQRLVTEANTRTQGMNEPVRDYITCLVAIMGKMTPPPPLHQQLDLLHQNLKPQLVTMVRRKEFRTVEELLEAAQEAEQTLESARAYQHPPVQEKVMLPELACQDQPRQAKNKEPKVAAAATEASGSPMSLEETLRRMEKSLAQLASSLAKPRKSSPRRNGGGKSTTSKPSTPPEARIPPESAAITDKGTGSRPSSPRPGQNTPPSGRRQFTCFGCGKPGHRIAECPQKQGNSQ